MLGELVGVNVAIRAGAQGIGFAIPVDQMIHVAADMISGRKRFQTLHSMTFQDLLSPRCYGDMEYCRFDITDSPLWYPLLARPHVGFRVTVQLLYHATVFGWLALPRVVRLVRDLARLTRYRRHLLRPSAWQP